MAELAESSAVQGLFDQQACIIEPVLLANAERHAMFLGECKHLIGIRKAERHGFLNQHRHSLSEAVFGYFCMTGTVGGNGNHVQRFTIEHRSIV
ncbi:hypothetical protein DSECCO2_634570 [anaerobic digester metagenome]